MRRTILSATAAAMLACSAFAAHAQTPSAPVKPAQKAAPAATARTPTAAEIIERSLDASGDRKTAQARTSIHRKGTLEVPAQGLSGTVEVYNKAPNKFLLVMELGNVFKSRQGFDGETAWSSDSLQGTRVLAGAEAAIMRREALIGAEQQWRELWKGAEYVGTKEVDGRATHVVKMIPKEGEGHPVTFFYDAETYLPVRTETVVDTPMATMPVVTSFADYRTVEGLKVPFVVEYHLPTSVLRQVYTDVKFDVPIEDTLFAMPK